MNKENTNLKKNPSEKTDVKIWLKSSVTDLEKKT